ncbi:carboxypeptidase-like regulatory domain-containing protein [Subsaximicrobium wynnwilliamsii]|uniref:Carboxypeptidase-like regulatory domain-containing protein n=1 Tax=Subsaximicrobium wynnwilliamsii TaxID=291179 RepID=A0A5C6ZIR5_9FLAO|nr:carboxypeptidase regulatory-like domain-containing protein [Subsaximicrobium wynnwilliamsii]TXD83896.1 carboxypeptidase-like regulatory domain-containing protein [Subsaximicrobium wynnwilliamsii]TXD89636.1 carboxypeptidase-like regulatory domain-containing protein [Subsaximicrobium wynnwilliamsii]TXE02572.1 carboxypeptidase-like regulatory domain-containing protein [Subsaximicrobium wynnwilliamsii]
MKLDKETKNLANVLGRLVLIILPFLSLNSQNIVVSGQITDTLQTPLSYANILAIPDADDQEVRFAITEADGSYKLGLAKNQSYKVTVSYLGYSSQILEITTTEEDIIKSFILQENPDQLNEVELNYTPPISVKKDTITYNVDSFKTGEERKLRDVLKKLPGVEVDRDGNVTVQGKKVTKVLVENKTFFTGDSKLAVNNIPADAVDQVVVLDNYNEVAMLKGLQDSDDMAMNIKLKEDKKKFAFGDVEVGAGIKDRYLIHPNLFYYSPKTNINFIGDLNNRGVKSFTFRDYLEFEGGFGKLLEDTGNYFSLYNSDFAQYLNNQDFKSNTNQFGALNIRQAINSKTDISGYIITSNSKTETESSTLNEYLNFTEPFVEERNINNTLRNFFTIAKITLDYDPSYDEDLAYNSFVKLSNNDSNGLIATINPTQSNRINTRTDVTGINLKQNLSYSRKLSTNHTATLEATYEFQNDKPLTEWLTNRQILQGLIPLEDDVVYNILQTKHSNAHNVNAIVKDYWVLNNFNHLYASVGVNAAFTHFENQDVQLLSDGSVNNFSSAGFGNDFGYDFINTFVGFEYKFQIGIATFKPMLYYNFYKWNTKQFDERFSNQKALLLPKFTTKVEFNNSEKLNFRYQLNARFPSIDRLANNFVLSSFNSVFKGDTTLDNQLYHSVNLSYYKFSLFKNLNFNINSSYNKKIKSFKTVTQLQGIEQFSTAILFDRPEQSWMLSSRFSKKIKKLKYNFSARYSYTDFYQLLNGQTNLNISKSLSSTLSIETSFKEHPNVEVGYTKDFNNYRAFGAPNNFENDRFFINLDYDFLENFILKADYSFDAYNNKSANIKNTFDTANASLFYQLEDSPWGFEINASNLFDVGFKQQNNFNSFVISDSKTFILPRIIMFKLAYKL